MTTKHDEGKPRWDLTPAEALLAIVMVLTFGAAIYGDDNWRTVPNARRRYFRAAIGHLYSWWRGEELDTLSGLPHLAHAACCIMFLLEFDVAARGRPYSAPEHRYHDARVYVDVNGATHYDAGSVDVIGPESEEEITQP